MLSAALRIIRSHRLSAYAKFSEKQKSFTPLVRTRACTYQGGGNVSFLENLVCVINEQSLSDVIYFDSGFISTKDTIKLSML